MLITEQRLDSRSLTSHLVSCYNRTYRMQNGACFKQEPCLDDKSHIVYLNTDFVTFFLSVLKISMNVIKLGVLKCVPTFQDRMCVHVGMDGSSQPME